MKKTLFLIICFFVLLFNVEAIELDLNSKYAYVYNLTEDKVIYEKGANEEVKVASMTKIMTAIIVIENNKNLDEEVVILDEDLRDMYEYTTVGFQAGDKVTIRDLLYGILLKSGSDAVNAAVRVTTKSEEQFIDLMNQKVKELSLTHTHFSNAVGKDEDNYSSVYDIARIMEYCLKNKTFKEIISTQTYVFEDYDIEIGGPLYNTESKYGIDLSIVNGSKSGYTTEAKHCLVSYSENEDLTYIVVTDNAENYKELLNDTYNIYNYLYTNFKYVDYNIDFDLDIENGIEEKYNVKIKTKLYLENGYDENLISYKYNGIETINFLKNKGNKLGTVSIYYDNELIKEVEVKINKKIEFKTEAYSNIIIVVAIISIIIISLSLILLLKKKLKKNNIKTKYIVPKIEPIKVEHKIQKEVKEENKEVKKLNILKTTTNVKLFFETLKSSSHTIKDKEKFEHDFIDRCFEKIDFKNLEDLKKLYNKLKLYKKDMSDKTIKYYNKLFKYCIDKYVDKKQQ